MFFLTCLYVCCVWLVPIETRRGIGSLTLDDDACALHVGAVTLARSSARAVPAPLCDPCKCRTKWVLLNVLMETRYLTYFKISAWDTFKNMFLMHF